MLVPQTKEVNDILLFKFHQNGLRDVACKSPIVQGRGNTLNFYQTRFFKKEHNMVFVFFLATHCPTTFSICKVLSSSMLVIVKYSLEP